jgi:hypothetical protein
MKRLLLILTTLLLTPAVNAADQDYEQKIKPFLKNHCISCHGPKKEKGDLRLDKLPFHLNDFDNVEEWQYILDELNQANMPPEDEKPPPVEQMANVIELIMDKVEAAKRNLYGKDKPIVMRRLNQRDYSNSVFELTGIKIREERVPGDPQSDTFDTDGGNLFMSPFHFGQYQHLAKIALSDAINFKPRPKVTTIEFKPVAGTDISPHSYNSRAVEKIRENQKKLQAFFKEFKIPLKSALTNHPVAESKKRLSKGLANIQKADKELLDHVLISPWAINVHSYNGLANRHLLSLYKMFGKKQAGMPPGTYRFKITCGYGNMKKGDKAYISIGNDGGKETGLAAVEGYDFVEVKATSHKPQTIIIDEYIDLTKTNGPRDGHVYHIKPLFQNQLDITPGMKKARNKTIIDMPFIMISKVEVSGPHFEEWPTAAHKKIFPRPQGQQSESDYARAVISSFTKKAFRNNPPTQSYLEKLMGIYRAERTKGKALGKAIQTPLAVVLASPSFLYMAEENVDNKKDLISDEELAIRLSYFLWSAPPDDTLLKLAKAKKLSDPKILKSQAVRLIRDKRSERFSKGFVDQWLNTGDVAQRDVSLTVRANYFSSTVQKSMAKEPVFFFDKIMRSNYSMTNFIDSEFVVVNKSLANYYGVPIPEASGFQMVKLPKNSPRGGLVGQGAFHLIASDGQHTKPILRGAFVLSKIIGKPTAEPPPNIDMIDADSREKISAKELLALHTERPQCRSCHQKIDPLGWGLENFDPISKWRTIQPLKKMDIKERRKVGKVPVDNEGQMPNGSKYKGLEEYKTQLMTYKDQFSESLITELLSYGLGKRISIADEKTVEAILLKAQKNDYKLGQVILDIACSESFRMK